MQRPHRVAEWGAPWAGAGLPGRVAVALIAGLSALLWVAAVRIAAWWLAVGV